MNNEAWQKTSEALNISYSYNAIASCNLKRLRWKSTNIIFRHSGPEQESGTGWNLSANHCGGFIPSLTRGRSDDFLRDRQL
jgi:hypothetical protein